MKITPFTLSHLNQAAELFNQYRVFYCKESNVKKAAEFLRERFVKKESVIFLCVDENGESSAKTHAICGFMQLYPSFSSVSLSPILILNDLYVSEKYRQKGIGKMFLDEAKKYAKEQGAVRLALSTARTNQAAQSLYKNNGYIVDEEYLSYNLSI